MQTNISRNLKVNAISRIDRWIYFLRLLPVLAFLLISSRAYGQFGDYFGFGKNKVHYKKFDWSIIKTEHFDLYFYEEERQAALDAAELSERSYAYLSEILDYKFKKKIPLLLYASQTIFICLKSGQERCNLYRRCRK